MPGSRCNHLSFNRFPTLFAETGGSNALYWIMGGLASIGVLETAYLTFEKLTGGPVACAVGGGGCSDVLDSEYGTLFGQYICSTPSSLPPLASHVRYCDVVLPGA